jgi:hypothetical protein
MVSSGMLRCVALVITDVSEEPSTSFIRVTRIGELGTTLAVNSNRFLTPWWRRRQVPPKSRFLQEPHGVTSQKTPFVNWNRILAGASCYWLFIQLQDTPRLFAYNLIVPAKWPMRPAKLVPNFSSRCYLSILEGAVILHSSSSSIILTKMSWLSPRSTNSQITW